MTKRNDKNALNAKQLLFCEEYLKTGNAGQSYITVYTPTKGSRPTWMKSGAKLLLNPNVMGYIETSRAAATKKLGEETAFGVMDVLKRWVDIATADPNELVKHLVGCCRYCYGIDHKYQWTDSEFREECARASNHGQGAPDEQGGLGFDGLRQAHPRCPRCLGAGVGRIVIADTDKLQGKAKLLYAGCKYTKHGVEIILRDQDDALRCIAKYMGMFKEIYERNDKPPSVVQIPSANLDPLEASRIYREIMTGSG